MSFNAIGWAVQQQTGSGVDKAVLIQLASLADERDFCFPSIAYLVAQTEFKESAVKAASKRLEDAGFIAVDRERLTAGGHQTSNGYTLLRDPQQGVVSRPGGVVTRRGGGRETTPTQSSNQQEKTSSSRPAPRGITDPKIIEVAREAEAGTLRKQPAADRGRSVDTGPVTSGWPKHRTRRAPTPSQRCFGIAERFREQALAAYPDEAMQASTDGVYKTLRRILAESPGLTWEHLDKSSELFWKDAASLHHPGVPVWKNFMHHLPQLAEKARRELTPAISPEEWFAGRLAKKRGPMTEEEIAQWAKGR